jgi:hypothetical protein
MFKPVAIEESYPILFTYQLSPTGDQTVLPETATIINNTVSRNL